MSQESDSTDTVLRRRVLQALGAAGVPLGLAGCGGDGDGTPTTGDGDGGDGDGDGDGMDGDGDTPTETATPTATPTPQDTLEYSEGGTLRASLASNPSSFDPPYSSGVPSSAVQNFFYESLMTTDARGNMYPWLAESFELVDFQEVGPADYTDYMTSFEYAADDEGTVFLDLEGNQLVVQDPENPGSPSEGDEGRALTVNEAGDAVADGTYGMHYRFELHEGITFHNGEELTAQNVVDSYRRYENSQVSAQVWLNFLHAEAEGDYTVSLYAQKPSAEALRNIVWLVFPSDHIDLPGGELDPRSGNNPVGTGAFKFEEFEDAEFLRVTPYEDYWLQDVGIQNKEWFNGPSNFPNLPVVDEVDMTFISDNSTRASALQEGEIDVANGLNAQQQTNYDDADGFNVVPTETGGYLFFQYPVQVEPWGNQNVRRAANHLIPRQQIVDNIEQGWARPAWTPLPKLAYGSGTTDPEALEEDLKPMNEYDTERAEELINEAGVETPIETTIETNSDNDNRVQKAELIAEAMNNTGLFDVDVETFEFGTFVGRILSPDNPERNNIILVGLSGTFDPGSFCEATHHTRNIGQCCNSNGFSNEDLDEMMDNAKFGTEVLDDAEERASRYDEVWREIVELSGTSYVDIDQTVAVTNDAVKNWETYPFPEGMYSYALHSPADSQLMYIDRE